MSYMTESGLTGDSTAMGRTTFLRVESTPETGEKIFDTAAGPIRFLQARDMKASGATIFGVAKASSCGPMAALTTASGSPSLKRRTEPVDFRARRVEQRAQAVVRLDLHAHRVGTRRVPQVEREEGHRARARLGASQRRRAVPLRRRSA